MQNSIFFINTNRSNKTDFWKWTQFILRSWWFGNC